MHLATKTVNRECVKAKLCQPNSIKWYNESTHSMQLFNDGKRSASEFHTKKTAAAQNSPPTNGRVRARGVDCLRRAARLAATEAPLFALLRDAYGPQTTIKSFQVNLSPHYDAVFLLYSWLLLNISCCSKRQKHALNAGTLATMLLHQTLSAKRLVAICN